MKRSNKSTSSWVLHMLSSSELITCSAAGSIKAWRTRRRLTLSECERTNLRNKLTSSSKCHLQIWTSCQEFRLFFRPQVSLTTQPPSLPPPIKERTGPIRRSEAGGSSSLTNLFVSSFFNMEEEEEEEEDYSFCVVTLCLDISAPPPPLNLCSPLSHRNLHLVSFMWLFWGSQIQDLDAAGFEFVAVRMENFDQLFPH